MVHWGINRTYHFDFYAKKHIAFRGKIIAAIVINLREIKSNTEGIFSFFPIKESEYCEEARAVFVSEVLPNMRKWFSEVKNLRSRLGGCCEMLVELKGKELKAHVVRYS